MILNLIIILSTVTVFCALFILKTKTIGEWSLLAASYLLFLLFVLYWKSGNGKLDYISILVLFLFAFLNAAHEVMGAFCWDFIFRLANGGVRKILWKKVSTGGFEHVLGHQNAELIKKEVYEDIIRFELHMIHPLFIEAHYLLDFDKDIEIVSGEVKISFKNKESVTLKSGDFIVIRRKEIHTFETITNSVFKLTCRK